MHALLLVALLFLPSSHAQEVEAPKQASPVSPADATAKDAASADSKANVEAKAPAEPPSEKVEPPASPAASPVLPLPPAPPPVEGTVTQIFRDKKVVIATLSQAPASTTPMRLAFVNAKGEACEGDATQVKDNIVTVQFEQCSILNEIVAGSKLTPSLLAVAPPAAAPPPEGISPSKWVSHRRLKFSLSIGYDASNKITFDSANFSNGTSNASGSLSYDVENGTDIAAAVIYAPENSVGVLGGFTIQPTRGIKGGTVTSNGDSVDFIYSDKPTFQFDILEVNMLYRWTFVYILPIGLNYSNPTMNPTTSANVTAEGGIGYQTGVGFMPNEYWRFEILYREITGSVKLTLGSETEDLGTGHLAGLLLRTGVMF
jgi:hypothetical protein